MLRLKPDRQTHYSAIVALLSTAPMIVGSEVPGPRLMGVLPKWRLPL
jgi:hypothetical protein